MGNMHLVTGYQGQDHVTAADHGSLYAAIFGNGSYVLDRGNKLAASVISSNKVRISDGDIVLQGRHIRLNEGAAVELTIANGTQGYKRNDLIVARYTRNASTGIEEANLVVIKGTASTSTPANPAYNNGNILTNHAEVVDFPLYRVPLDGITVGTLEQLFDVAYLVTLGSDKKIPSDYLPSMDYIPSNQKGKANGVATLDASGKLTAEIASTDFSLSAASYLNSGEIVADSITARKYGKFAFVTGYVWMKATSNTDRMHFLVKGLGNTARSVVGNINSGVLRGASSNTVYDCYGSFDYRYADGVFTAYVARCDGTQFVSGDNWYFYISAVIELP